MSSCLIILAGGNSHRFKSNIGKPYQKIAGKSLIEINVEKARQFKLIKKIVVILNHAIRKYNFQLLNVDVASDFVINIVMPKTTTVHMTIIQMAKCN